MNAAHTPGPWKVETAQRGFVIAATHIDYDMAVVRDVGNENNEANAHLIAAAPDLLEAAKLVVAWYEAEDDHSKADFRQRMQMCRDSEDALRSAIAKATGGAA